MLISSGVAELDALQIDALHSLLERWATLWRVPDLAKSVGLRSSTRLRRSLGNYRASRQQITLAAWLLDESCRALLEEVLCHEAAHAAVHLSRPRAGRWRWGRVRTVRPHGPEWRAFMEAAGHAPRVRIPESLMPNAVRVAMSASRRWEHRCPVCQATRMARTRVIRWRCRTCVEAGRSGRLVIERVGAPIEVDS